MIKENLSYIVGKKLVQNYVERLSLYQSDD